MSKRSFTPEEEAFLAALMEQYQEHFHEGFVKNDAHMFAVSVNKLSVYNSLVVSGAITFYRDGRISSIVVIDDGGDAA